MPVLRSAVQGQHVLVLGAGFLGSNIARRLVEDGFEVTVAGRSQPRPELSQLVVGATVLVQDLTTMSAVEGLIDTVDHVVYALGSSSPAESVIDPARDISLVLPPVVRLLDLLRRRPMVGITFVSSGGAVYGNIGGYRADESVPPQPISSYGILKLTAERYVTMYSNLYGIPATILRVSNVYGPGQPWSKGQGVVATLMHCAMSGSTFTVFGAGDNVRDYVFVDDVARAVSDLVATGRGHVVLNAGSGVGHSITDVLKLVEDVSGRAIPVEHRAARSFDVDSIVLDISRISERIQYAPTDLYEGLTLTWAKVCPVDPR